MTSGSYDAATKTTVVAFAGSVHFSAHAGELDLTFARPRVEIRPTGAKLFVAMRSRPLGGSTPTDYGDVHLATVDVSGRDPAITPPTTTWSALPTALTAAGVQPFASFYEAGQALDPFTFTYDGPGGKPDVAPGETWTPAGTVRWQPTGAAAGVPSSVADSTGDPMGYHSYPSFARNATARQLLALDGRGGRLTVVDEATLTRVGTPIDGLDAAVGGLAVDEQRNVAYTVAAGWGNGPLVLNRVDVAARTVTRFTIPGGERGMSLPELAVDQRSGRVLVSERLGGHLFVIDGRAATMALLQTFSFDAYGGSGVDVDETTGDVYLATGSQSTVRRLTPNSGAGDPYTLDPTPVATFDGATIRLQVSDDGRRIWVGRIVGSSINPTLLTRTTTGWETGATIAFGPAMRWFGTDGASGDLIGAIAPRSISVVAADTQHVNPLTLDLPASARIEAAIRTADGDALWALDGGDSVVRRISRHVSPTVSAQPDDATVTVSPAQPAPQATFTTTASGTPAPTVRWQAKAPGGAWEDVPGAGATGTTLTVDGATGTSRTAYRAIFTNAVGSHASEPATLTVDYATGGLDRRVWITGGALDWGVKASFRRYVGGPIAHGAITTGGGATANGDGTFRFAADGGTYDPASGRATLRFGGSVRFSGHAGQLDLTIARPRLEIDGGVATLHADVSSKSLSGGVVEQFTGVDLARVDLGTPAAGPAVAGGRLGWRELPAALTANGAPAFAAFYPAGTALDPLSIDVAYSTEEPRTSVPPPVGRPAPPAQPAPTPTPVRKPARKPAAAAIAAVRGAQAVGRNRIARVATVACGSGAGACTVKVPARVRVRIGGRLYTAQVLAPKRLKAGARGNVRVRLSKRAAARLARRSTRVTLRVVTTAGPRTTVKAVSVRLIGPKRG